MSGEGDESMAEVEAMMARKREELATVSGGRQAQEKTGRAERGPSGLTPLEVKKRSVQEDLRKEESAEDGSKAAPTNRLSGWTTGYGEPIEGAAAREEAKNECGKADASARKVKGEERSAGADGKESTNETGVGGQGGDDVIAPSDGDGKPTKEAMGAEMREAAQVIVQEQPGVASDGEGTGAAKEATTEEKAAAFWNQKMRVACRPKPGGWNLRTMWVELEAMRMEPEEITRMVDGEKKKAIEWFGTAGWNGVYTDEEETRIITVEEVRELMAAGELDMLGRRWKDGVKQEEIFELWDSATLERVAMVDAWKGAVEKQVESITGGGKTAVAVVGEGAGKAAVVKAIVAAAAKKESEREEDVGEKEEETAEGASERASEASVVETARAEDGGESDWEAEEKDCSLFGIVGTQPRVKSLEAGVCLVEQISRVKGEGTWTDLGNCVGGALAGFQSPTWRTGLMCVEVGFQAGKFAVCGEWEMAAKLLGKHASGEAPKDGLQAKMWSMSPAYGGKVSVGGPAFQEWVGGGPREKEAQKRGGLNRVVMRMMVWERFHYNEQARALLLRSAPMPIFHIGKSEIWCTKCTYEEWVKAEFGRAGNYNGGNLFGKILEEERAAIIIGEKGGWRFTSFESWRMALPTIDKQLEAVKGSAKDPGSMWYGPVSKEKINDLDRKGVFEAVSKMTGGKARVGPWVDGFSQKVDGFVGREPICRDEEMAKRWIKLAGRMKRDGTGEIRERRRREERDAKRRKEGRGRAGARIHDLKRPAKRGLMLILSMLLLGWQVTSARETGCGSGEDLLGETSRRTISWQGGDERGIDERKGDGRSASWAIAVEGRNVREESATCQTNSNASELVRNTTTLMSKKGASTACEISKRGTSIACERVRRAGGNGTSRDPRNTETTDQTCMNQKTDQHNMYQTMESGHGNTIKRLVMFRSSSSADTYTRIDESYSTNKQQKKGSGNRLIITNRNRHISEIRMFSGKTGISEVRVADDNESYTNGIAQWTERSTTGANTQGTVRQTYNSQKASEKIKASEIPEVRDTANENRNTWNNQTTKREEQAKEIRSTFIYNKEDTGNVHLGQTTNNTKNREVCHASVMHSKGREEKQPGNNKGRAVDGQESHTGSSKQQKKDETTSNGQGGSSQAPEIEESTDGTNAVSVVEEGRRRDIRVVSVNVHTLAGAERSEGGGAAGGARVRRLGINKYMGRLIDHMKTETQDGTRKFTAIYILASTQLRDNEEIEWAKNVFRTVTAMHGSGGYECKETHGVPGKRSRKEIGGVMICWDPRSVREVVIATAKGNEGKAVELTRRVVARGRAIQMRFGTIGGGARASGEQDFEVLGVYQAPRGEGREGHPEAELNEEIERVSTAVHKAAIGMMKRGRGLIAGDFNAETAEMLKLRRGGRGSTATPSDTALEHMISNVNLVHAHEIDSESWTYTNMNKGKAYHTWIDHMYATPSFAQHIVETGMEDNIVERGNQRHKLLWITYRTEMARLEGWGPVPTKAVPTCPGNSFIQKRKHWECRDAYTEIVMELYVKGIKENVPREGKQGIWWIQDISAEAMRRAVRGDRAGEEAKRRKRDKQEQVIIHRKLKQKGGERKGESGRDKIEHDGLQRLRVLKEMVSKTPTTNEGWQKYLPQRGAGTRYGSFSRKSDLQQRIRLLHQGAKLKSRGVGRKATSEAIENIGYIDKPWPAWNRETTEEEDRASEIYEGQGEMLNSEDKTKLVDGEGWITHRGLLVARRIWQGENSIINEIIEDVQETTEDKEEESKADYTSNMMREAIRKKQGVEATAAALVATMGEKGGGKAGSASNALTTVKRLDEAGKTIIDYEPRAVREAAKAQAEDFSRLRPFNIKGCLRLMNLGEEPPKAKQREEEGDEWIANLFSNGRVRHVIQSFRGTGQAAGPDGYKGVLLKWAPFDIQDAYAKALREAVQRRDMPEEWATSLITMLDKRGKDPTWLKNRRDVWNQCHGFKVTTGCLDAEYKRVQRQTVRGSAVGFRENMEMGMAMAVGTAQSEEAESLCGPNGRLYIDYKGFFMGVQRKLLYELEEELGVCKGVTECIQVARDLMETARVKTAYGMSDALKCLSGTGQGCKLGPVRATLQLVITMEAVHALANGHCFIVPKGAARMCIAQALYADDMQGPSSSGQGIQLTLDVAFVAARMSGNEIGVEERATKTAYHLTQCAGGEHLNDISYQIQTGDGVVVPQVMESYRLLGQEVDGSVGNIVSRDNLVTRSKMWIASIGSLGGLGLGWLERLWSDITTGLSLTFGGPTPTGWSEAEEIEKTKRKTLARLGERSWRGSRSQIYETRGEGGMGIEHSYVRAAGATLKYFDDGFRAARTQPHGMVISQQIALSSWRWGWFPTREHPTPISWKPPKGRLQMRTNYLTEAWWIVLEDAGIRVQATGSNKGWGDPLDPNIEANKITCDGGGPAIWEDDREWSVECTGSGMVRAIDIYGGKDSEGKGRWRTWKEAKAYYIRNGASSSKISRMSAVYNQLLEDEQRKPGELTEWLEWFSEHTEKVGTIKEHPKVEAIMEQQRIGWSCEKLGGVKKDGRQPENNEFLCEWGGLTREQDEWIGKEAVIEHWKRSEDSWSKATRRREAIEAMNKAVGDAMAKGGIPEFRFSERIVRKRGQEAWDQFARGTQITDEQEEWVISELKEHVRDVARPEPARTRRADELRSIESRELTVNDRQQLYGGHVETREVGDMEEGLANEDSGDMDLSGGAEIEDTAHREQGDGGGQGSGETAREVGEVETGTTADTEETAEIGQGIAWIMEKNAVHETGETETETGAIGETGGADEEDEEGITEWKRLGPKGIVPQLTNEGEKWLGDKRGRTPSLAAASASEEERIREYYQKTPKESRNQDRTGGLREGLDGAWARWVKGERKGVDIWHWEEGRELWDNPIVKATRRVFEVETAWGADHATPEKRALFRGEYGNIVRLLETGGELDAKGHSGTLREHVEDIQRGSREERKGISFTKDEYIAARYAAESDGEGVCVLAAKLEEGDSWDMTDINIQEKAMDAGANEKTIAFVETDAEWRYGRNIAGSEFQGHNGGLIKLNKARETSGSLQGQKGGYQLRISAKLRQQIAAWGQRCEERGNLIRGLSLNENSDSPGLRMDYEEASGMDWQNSWAIAHMATTLDDEYEFTEVCATDGSYIKEIDKASYGVWWGKDGEGTIMAEGGGMPKGSTIQDAELAAIMHCVGEADKRGEQQGGEDAPRVLILSDCRGILLSIENAWRAGSLTKLRGKKRAGMLEYIISTRSKWETRGGSMVFLWTKSHQGVYGNSYADMVAKAYLDTDIGAWVKEAPDRKASIGRYEVKLRDGGWSWIAGEKGALELAEKGINEYVRDRIRREDKEGRSILTSRLGTGNWPWRSEWTGVLRESWVKTKSGGKRGKATEGGAVMMLRSGYLGLREDYASDGGMSAANRVAEFWKEAGVEGTKLANKAKALIRQLSGAVAEVPGNKDSEYVRAIAAAMRTILHMSEEGSVSNAEEWRQTRAVAGGALPKPTKEEIGRTIERDGMGDRKWWRGRVSKVAKICRKLAMTILESARQWRDANDPKLIRETEEGESDDEAIEVDRQGDTAFEENEKGEREQPEECVTQGVQQGLNVATQSKLTLFIGGECKGQKPEGEERIWITRGTGLGNPFPLGEHGKNRERWVRELSVRTHERWLEAGSVQAIRIRGEGETEGMPLPAEIKPIEGEKAPKESYMTGNEQKARLKTLIEKRKKGTETIRLCCSTTCNRGELCHGGGLARQAVEIIQKSNRLGDRLTTGTERKTKTQRGGEEGVTSDTTITDKGLRTNEDGDIEEATTLRDKQRGGTSQIEAEDGIRRGKGKEEGQSSREGERRGEEEGGEATEEKDGSKRKRGPRRSSAVDADMMQWISTLRFEQGNDRQTGQTIRRIMKETGCGTPWRKTDKNRDREGQDTWRENVRGFDSDDDMNTVEDLGRDAGKARRLRDRNREAMEEHDARREEAIGDGDCDMREWDAAIGAGGRDGYFEEWETGAAREHLCGKRRATEAMATPAKKKTYNRRDSEGGDGGSTMAQGGPSEWRGEGGRAEGVQAKAAVTTRGDGGGEGGQQGRGETSTRVGVPADRSQEEIPEGEARRKVEMEDGSRQLTGRQGSGEEGTEAEEQEASEGGRVEEGKGRTGEGKRKIRGEIAQRRQAKDKKYRKHAGQH